MRAGRAGVRRVAFVVASASLFLALAHCGDAIFEGTNSDASTDDKISADAASDATTSPSDAETSEASTGLDPCVGAEHWICDDFDRTSAINAPPYWNSITTTQDASLALMPPGPPAPPSLPNALVAFAGTGETANVARSGLIAAKGIHCEVDVRIDSEDTDYGTVFLLISLTTADGSFYRLEAQAGPGAGSTGEGFADYGEWSDGGSFVGLTQAHTFPRHAWTHLSLQAALGPSGAVAVRVDGADSDFVPVIDPSKLAVPQDVVVVVGPTNYSGNGVWGMGFDNAYCDLVP